MEDVVRGSLNPRQYLCSAQPRQAQLRAQFGLNFFRQVSPSFKKLAGACEFQSQQFLPSFVAAPGAQVVKRIVEPRHVFLRQIDAIAGEVYGDVLPEVGELERGADVVRQLKQVGVVIAE